jgi:hypothetical protein
MKVKVKSGTSIGYGGKFYKSGDIFEVSENPSSESEAMRHLLNRVDIVEESLQEA